MAIEMKKLIAIMRMTESSSDGEALNALRLANKMLKDEGKHWGDVIGLTQTMGRPVTPDYRTPPSKRAGGATGYGRHAPQGRPSQDNTRVVSDDIETMLTTLGAQKHDVSTLMFLASLRDHWERKGYLTQPQYDTLKAMEDFKRPTGRSGRWRF